MIVLDHQCDVVVAAVTHQVIEGPTGQDLEGPTGQDAHPSGQEPFAQRRIRTPGMQGQDSDAVLGPRRAHGRRTVT